MGSLSGSIALVTGASRGVGAGIVRLLAGAGATVILNHRDSAEQASAVLSALPGKGHLCFQADVSRRQQVWSMFQEVGSRYSRLDLLVNNAGLNRDGDLEDLTEEMWDTVLATNLKGPFLCSQAAAPLMAAAHGASIVNISAQTALTGRAGGCNYVAAKAGLIGLTKCLAQELAPAVRVNCLALGLIQTEEVWERYRLHQGENLDKALSQIPLGRVGTVEDVARAVLFLASQDSDFMTGQVIAVGGGKWM